MVDPAAAKHRPTSAALVAALMPFLGVPVSLALFLIALEREPEFSRFAVLAHAWNEGGWWMYLVLLTSGAVAVVSAALTFFGALRGSVAVLGSASLSALIVGSGAFGYLAGVRGSANAVTYANPADRATIMAAASSEALNCSAFGFACATGLLACLAAGSLVAAFAQAGLTRRLLFAAGAMFCVLGALDGVMLLRLVEVKGALRAVAQADPGNRLAILSASELDPYRLWLLSAIAALAAVLALGASALEASPRAALLLLVFGSSGLGSIGIQIGAYSLANQELEGFSNSLRRDSLVALDGFPSLGATWCLKGDEVIDWKDGVAGRAVPHDEVAEQVAERVNLANELHEAVGDARSRPFAVPICVMPGASAASLWRVLEAAMRAGAEVELVGEGVSPPSKVLGELRGLAKMMESIERQVPVGLARYSSRCSAGCQLVTAQGERLKVGQEFWDAAPLIGAPGALKEEVLLKADQTIGPEQLMRLAAASAVHVRRLVVLLADSPADSAGAGDPQADGGLSRDEILKVIKAHQAEVKFCYEQQLQENPSLAGKVTVRWSVNARGQVEDAFASENTLGAASSCILERVRRWRFPRPRGGGRVEVNFPWTFVPAD